MSECTNINRTTSDKFMLLQRSLWENDLNHVQLHYWFFWIHDKLYFAKEMGCDLQCCADT